MSYSLIMGNLLAWMVVILLTATSIVGCIYLDGQERRRQAAMTPAEREREWWDSQW